MKTPAEQYRYSFDPDSDEAPAQVMRFVGCGKTVLELGAGPGSITRPLVELNGNRLTALDRDAECVAILEQFCDEALQADLDDPAWPQALQGRRFDAVVIADVLEHLRDPWTTLRLAGGLLTEQGSVVVCLPHGAHAAVLACLMDNDFAYGEWGLLDRTHIRFFGMKNIQALFEGAGLKIAEYSYYLGRPEHTELAEHWRALPARARAALEEGDFAHVYQVIVRAVPAARDPALPGYHLPACKPPRANRLQFIAFYLPQFHPIPENDAWWGKGFTEWTNTARAEKLFPDHYQPHVPADFGYYDLRVRTVQHEQIAYARAHGIDAFCFHYYWFGGRRLLQRPIEDFLADQAADIRFCLCWANENWTRRWDASENDVLIAQDYSPAHDIAFMESLLPYFRDRRYLRVRGAPLLVVYRPQQMPDPAATVRRWRQFCRANGVGEIHLVAALTHNNTEFESFGFDAGVEFPPHNLATPNLRDAVGAPRPLTGYVTPYGDIAQAALARDYVHPPVYRCVFPSWDNTARLGDAAIIVLGGTPENYERWLAEAAHRTVAERAPTDRLVFINAWNEWAEGCHLEPDHRYGMHFLEATRRVKQGESRLDPVFPPVVLPRPEPEPVVAEVPEPDPIVVVAPEPAPPSPETRVDVVSLGLRTELGMWGVRRLGRQPFAYRLGRAFYRLVLKPLR